MHGLDALQGRTYCPAVGTVVSTQLSAIIAVRVGFIGREPREMFLFSGDPNSMADHGRTERTSYSVPV